MTPKLIAIVGGSGSGKTWLTQSLCRELGDDAMALSLDDFYRDRSHLEPSARTTINFDHPDSIDWTLFEDVLRSLQGGLTVPTPTYDFSAHTRASGNRACSPRPFIFVEGLWILWPPQVRELFDLRIFLDCAETLRLQRRLERDIKERGRTKGSVCEQFWNVVVPMHGLFVETQRPFADIILEDPIQRSALDQLLATIESLRTVPPPPALAPSTSIGTLPEAVLSQLL